MILGINHSSFTVSRLDRSVDFYSNVLGLKIIASARRPREYAEAVTRVKECELAIALLGGWDHVLELIEYVGSDKRNTTSKCDNIGAGHICFNVRDMRSTIQGLQDRGAVFNSEVSQVPNEPNKGAMVVYGRDPDGIIFELVEQPRRNQ